MRRDCFLAIMDPSFQYSTLDVSQKARQLHVLTRIAGLRGEGYQRRQVCGISSFPKNVLKSTESADCENDADSVFLEVPEKCHI